MHFFASKHCLRYYVEQLGMAFGLALYSTTLRSGSRQALEFVQEPYGHPTRGNPRDRATVFVDGERIATVERNAPTGPVEVGGGAGMGGAPDAGANGTSGGAGRKSYGSGDVFDVDADVKDA